MKRQRGSEDHSSKLSSQSAELQGESAAVSNGAGKKAKIEPNEVHDDSDLALDSGDSKHLRTHGRSNIKIEQNNRMIKCPFLDTINRQLLDFDSEKLCSVSLTNMNVYVCLVCGKFFQGRGKSTPAFTHSVQAGHFVFLNLHSGRAYCLPDDYEVHDSSLQDIVKCLAPSFNLRSMYALNRSSSLVRDVHGFSYLPGFVGLNNLRATDYLNCVLQALAHVSPFRDFWLQSDLHSVTKLSKSKIVQHFGLVMRKIWSADNFKSTVSPQELMQEIVLESKRRFSIASRSECHELLVWLFTVLQKGLSKHSSPTTATTTATAATTTTTSSASLTKGFLTDSSVIYEPFQGIVEVTSLTRRLVSNLEEKRLLDKLQPSTEENEWVRSVSCVPFNNLSLEIPPCPLFRDSEGGLVIPQVPLFEVLKKFDGRTWTDQITKDAHVRRCYRILKLPRYLLLHLVRFARNNFYLEKNPTIVTFPVKNFEMREFLHAAPSVASDDAAVDRAANSSSSNNSRNGNSSSNSNSNGSRGKRSSVDKAVAELQHYSRLRSSCPAIEALDDYSSSQLQQFIERFGSELHQLQLASVVQQTQIPAASVESIESKLSDAADTAAVDAAAAAASSGRQQQLLLVAKDAHKRLQLMRSYGDDDYNSSSSNDTVVRGGSKYDLVANICHDAASSAGQGGVAVGDLNMFAAGATAAAGGGNKSKASASSAAAGTAAAAAQANFSSANSAMHNNSVLNDGAFKVHVQHKATSQWFEIQDLRVSEVTPQLIGVSESNILVYELKS